LKEARDFIKKGSYGGIVPSGPQGIGKSAIGLLLAFVVITNLLVGQQEMHY
jgi:hypothetical protein